MGLYSGRIKKCPSCNSKAELEEVIVSFHDEYAVVCLYRPCAMTGPRAKTAEEAVENWNAIKFGK